MTFRAWIGNSVIFIMWNESDFTGTPPSRFADASGCCANPGGGHVLALVISRSLRKAWISDRRCNHYSMLATIEELAAGVLGENLRPAQRETDGRSGWTSRPVACRPNAMQALLGIPRGWGSARVLFCQESFAGGLGMLVCGPKSVSSSSGAAGRQPVGALDRSRSGRNPIRFSSARRRWRGVVSLLLSLGKEFD